VAGKVIVAAHDLGIQDGQVRGLVAGDLVDIGQLIAFRIHGPKVRVALHKAEGGRILHGHERVQPRPVDALRARVLTAIELIPKVETFLLRQLVGLVVVLDVELLQVVAGHEGCVIPKAIAVRQVHQHKGRMRLLEGKLDRIVIEDVHLH